MRHTAEKFPELIKGGEIKESNGYQYMIKYEDKRN